MSDNEILSHCSNDDKVSMITPYVTYPVRYVDEKTGIALPEEEQYKDHKGDARRVISYGPSSYGYDVRLSGGDMTLKLIGIKQREHDYINPKSVIAEHNLSPVKVLKDGHGARFVMIPPSSCLLGPTLEYFRIPRDTIVIVTGKSTYARSGLIVNVTPIEPEFEGNVVMEITNPSNVAVMCYLDEGIAQFIFHTGNEPCTTSYKDKGGKYQGQTGLTLSKV